MEAAKQLQLVLATADPEDESRLRSLLAGTPWMLVPVATVEEAITALENSPIPIVLLDSNLQGRAWRETTRLLIKARRRTCVIVIGKLESPDPGELSRFGAFDVMPRPLDKADLFATLLCAYSKTRLHWLSVTRVQASPQTATAV